jgi:putative ABC transport system permease protein
LVLAANATLFAAISATLYRPVPFRSGERTVTLITMPPGLSDAKYRNPLHAVDLVYFRTHSHTLADITGYSVEDRSLTGRGEPEPVRVLLANESLFRLTADRPLLGRAFTLEEEERNARVAVLNYGLWQRRFGGDTAVLGKALEIEGEPYTIVGVMPPTFPPPALTSGLIVPLGITGVAPKGDEARTYLPTLARITDGATNNDATSEIGALMQDVVRQYPRTHTGWTAFVLSYRDWQYGSFRAPLIALFAAMALLLLIASANIASLALANVSARRGEIALRRAIGASGGAIARLIVLEVAVLNLLGGGIGLLAAIAMLPAILAIDPAATRALGPVSIDWRVAAYAACSAILAAAIASLAPAIHAADGNLAVHGFGSNTRTHGSRTAGRWRSALLVTQTALCLMLLVTGGLVLRALTRSSAIAPGFDPGNVLTAQLRLPPERYATNDARTLVMEQLFLRLRAIPGVVDASQTLNSFTPGESIVTLVEIEGQPTADGSGHTVQFRRVSPSYFRTMRIRQLKGRAFTAQDSPTSIPAAVVSRSFAERFWHGLDPVGRHILRAKGALTVIGVVDDVSDIDLLQAPEPTLYLPWAQSSAALRPVALVIRSAGDPTRLAATVRSAVFSVDPGLTVDRLHPLQAFLSDSLAPQRFRATLLTLLGAIGLLLGAVGIAGVTARSIAERMTEFGVRLALGCDQATLWRSAVAGQLRFAGAGAALGLMLSLGAGKLMGYLLPEIGAADPFAIAAACTVLLVTTALAAAIPALRVLRLDPFAVLRN